jgi:hypothetical protein
MLKFGIKVSLTVLRFVMLHNITHEMHDKNESVMNYCWCKSSSILVQ